MTKLFSYLALCLLLCMTSSRIMAASPNTSILPQLEDSTVKILKLTKKRNQRVRYLNIGTKVRYWHVGTAGSRSGIIEGFVGDSLVIDGKAIALSQIRQIKKKDSPGRIVGKTFHVLGGLLVGGIYGAGILVWAIGPGEVFLGIMVILIGLAGASIPFFQGKRALHRTWKAEVIKIDKTDPILR